MLRMASVVPATTVGTVNVNDAIGWTARPHPRESSRRVASVGYVPISVIRADHRGPPASTGTPWTVMTLGT